MDSLNLKSGLFTVEKWTPGNLTKIRRTGDGAEAAWSVPLEGILTTNLAAVSFPDGGLVLGLDRSDGVMRGCPFDSKPYIAVSHILLFCQISQINLSLRLSIRPLEASQPNPLVTHFDSSGSLRLTIQIIMVECLLPEIIYSDRK